MKKLIKQYIDFKTSLKNKVVVITAGGGHLCSSFAFALVNSGCKVIWSKSSVFIKCKESPSLYKYWNLWV